jgi:hypothetical protein
VEEKEDDARNKKSTDIDEWDQKFMQVDQEMLFEIILVWPLPPPHYSTPTPPLSYLYSTLPIPILPLSVPY